MELFKDLVYPSVKSASVRQSVNNNGRLFKTLLTPLVGVFLACMAMLVSSSTFAAPELEGGHATTGPGQQVIIPVDLLTDGSVVALQFDLTFDDTVLSPQSVTSGTGLVGHDFDWQQLQPGSIRIVITSNSQVPLISGSLAELSLLASATAPAGAYPVVISNVVMADGSAQQVPATSIQDGSVTLLVVDAIPVPTLGLMAMLLLVLLFAGIFWLFHQRGIRGVAFSLFLGLTLFSTSIVRAAAPPGDANDDGVVDVNDIPIIVAQILERSIAPGDPDCNADQVVNVLDTICAATQPVVQNQAPDMIPPGNRVLQADDAFVTPIFATDPNLGDVLTFSLTSAPAGVSINPQSGMLSWTPGSGDLGVNEITALVTDPGGLSDTEIFSIEVVQSPVEPTPNAAPVLVVPADQNLVFDTLLSVQASATDADVGDTLAFEFINAPSGMTIDSVSGVIDWTPTESQIGSHDVAVKVTDTAGAVAVGNFIVMVADVNKAPVAVDDVYQARIGETLTVAPPGVLANDSDPNQDPLTSVLVSTTTQGNLDLRSDGSFDYTPEDSTTIGPVELEVQCDISIADGGVYQANGTVAVGDVDNDGELEIVGLSFSDYDDVSGIFWIINAADCSKESDQSTEINIINAGGMAASSHPGLLDIDGDGDLEIIALRQTYPPAGIVSPGPPDTRHLLALHHDGTPAWPGDSGSATSAYVLNEDLGSDKPGPTFADLDADGKVEILMVRTMVGVTHGSQRQVLTVYNSADGSIKWEHVGEEFFRDGRNRPPVVVDLDLDGTMEVIVNTSVVDHLGNTEYLLPADLFGGFPQYLTTAVANFDADPYPEIVARDTGQNYLFKHDGSVVWKTAHQSTSWARNQIAVADFDGDGEVEFAYVQTTAAFTGVITVFDNDGSVLWSHEGKPEYTLNSLHMNRSDNITAFDANADGVVDLVIQYSPVDNTNYGIYFFDGRDGSLLHYEAFGWNSTSQRFTTIADIDGDGEAELISSYTGGIEGFTRVWQGTAANPLPPAPPLHNQWVFNQAMVADDASIITNPTPRWLQVGLNGWNMLKQPPHPLAGTTDSFIYKANDGELDSNEATVTFDVQPAGNPPIFLSSPDTLTTTGFQYEYAPRVVDTDPGDSVSFILTAAPPGMTIDPATGVVHWLPGTTGSFQVFILASDTIGFSTPQSYTLLVGDPVEVPDLIGQPEATATTTLSTANLLVGRSQTANHPSIPAGAVSSQTPIAGAVAEFGSKVDLILSLGPAPEDIDDDTDGFTENQGDCNDNDNTIFPGANDIPGDGIDQDCDGIDGNLVLSNILVLPGDSTILTSQSVSLKAIGIFVDGTSQNLTTIANWSDGPEYSSPVAGVFVISASRGVVSGTVSITVVDRVLGDVAPPVAEISAPVSGERVNDPIEIIGTATDSNLLKYTLGLKPAGELNFVEIAASTSQVSNDVLGTLDPTTLVNGIYVLRLTVMDTGGNMTIAETEVSVEGGAKPGLFSLTFTDLSIPLGGMPVQISRTYDSRDKTPGDFGVGWSMSLKSFSVSCDALGSNWFVSKEGLAYGLLPTKSHNCSVRLPNGRIERFGFQPSPAASAIIPFSFLSGNFIPVPGALGSLKSLDNTNLLIVEPQPGPVSLLDDNTLAEYAPQLFEYTAENDFIFVIGADGLESVTDNNGNQLTFTPNAITHSAGVTLQLIRDPRNFITSMIDPMGNSQFYRYSDSGDLIEHIDNNGAVTRMFYDYKHLLIRIEDPLGHPMVRNEYDAEGRRIATEDAEGNRTTFSYNLAAGTVTTTNPDGTQMVVEYNPDGNVTRNSTMVTIDGSLTVVENIFEYDIEGNETVVVDADGLRVERNFDGSRVTQVVVDPAGLALTTNSQYNNSDDLLSVTDAFGYVRMFDNDARGNPVAVDGPGAVDQAFQYDTSGRLTEITDPLGDRTVMIYNPAGLVIAEERFNSGGDLLGRSELSYDLNGNLLESRLIEVGSANPPKVIRFTYDNNNRLLNREDPEGNIQSWEYDVSGNLTALVDALGRRTTYEFNANGFLIKTTLASGGVILNEYDALGNVKKMIDATGRVTEVLYDELGRRVATSVNGEVLEQRVFSPAGRLTAIVEADGKRTDYQRDSAGRITQIQLPEVIDGRTGSPMRPTVNKVLDELGRPLEIIDPNGRSTTFQYDSNGRISGRQAADGTSTSQVVDAAGRLLSVTNELGETINYVYDAMGRLVQVLQPAPVSGDPRPTTSYIYDSLNNLNRQIDALGRVTLFDYDDAGRLIREQLPDGSITLSDYDSVGQLIGVTESDGTLTNFSYDLNGRLTQRSSSTGEMEAISYNQNGARLSTIDSRGTTQYSYFTNGLLKSITGPLGSQIKYEYDVNQRISQMTADGDVVSYTYDANSRLATVSSQIGLTTYAYDPVGNPVQKTLPNGIKVDMLYNLRGRMTELTHSDMNGVILESFLSSYQADGRRLTIAELDGSQELYQYDNLGRLISAERTGPQPYQHAYEYDIVGNRIRDVIDGIETISGFDSNNRLIFRGADLYSYDLRGNRIGSTVNGEVLTYQWDSFKRMTGVTYPGGTVAYEYDIDGQRVSENINGVETRFMFDQRNPSGYSQVVKELDVNGQGLVSYTYGLQILGQRRAAVNSFYSEDQHGSIRMLTNTANTVTDRYSYQPYGKMHTSSGVTDNRYAYSGERLDTVTGNYNLRARQYDPVSGGFISQDFYKGDRRNPSSMHSYLYAGADPINFADPLGLFSLAENSIVQSISSGLAKAKSALSFTKTFCRAKGAVNVVNTISAVSQIAVVGFAALSKIVQTPANVEGTFLDKINVEFGLGDGASLGLEIDPKFAENGMAIKLEIDNGQVKNSLTIEASNSGIKASGGVGKDFDLHEFTACGLKFATLSVGVEVGVETGVDKWNLFGAGSASASLKLGFGSDDKEVTTSKFSVGELSWKAIEIKYNSSQKSPVSGYAFGFTIPLQ